MGTVKVDVELDRFVEMTWGNFRPFKALADTSTFNSSQTGKWERWDSNCSMKHSQKVSWGIIVSFCFVKIIHIITEIEVTNHTPPCTCGLDFMPHAGCIYVWMKLKRFHAMDIVWYINMHGFSNYSRQRSSPHTSCIIIVCMVLSHITSP